MTDRITLRVIARLAATALTILVLTGPACGQGDNPIYVDISPRAWTLFQLAREQASENEGEAVRIYQELLDLHGEQLIPIGDRMRDSFVSARARVLEDLRSDTQLLERYRLMQSAEAERLLEIDDVLTVARTRSLTEAGLDAILRTAQEALEAARFRGAVAWLEEAIAHPDLAARQNAHCWFMLGLASHYLGNEERVRTAVKTLQEMGADGRHCLAELELLHAAGTGPRIEHGVTPLDRTSASDLRELVGQTIWSLPLEQSLLRRQYGDPAGDRPPPTSGYDRHRRRGELATIGATVAGNVVFVNEGHVVRALDRFTGRPVWSQPYSDRNGKTIHDRNTEDAGDMNVIAVEGDALVTLTGHAKAASRSGDGRIVRLDIRTGERRWATSLDRIGGDKEYEGLFPHGAPIIAEGRVYVLARKVTGQMLTGCYVVALDLADGSFLWIRHIASSGSKIRNARPYSTLVQKDGILFVASPVGAITAIDALSGSVRWLHRFSVPVNIRGRQRQPWEIGAPVLIDDRLVALTPNQRQIVVFDQRTGALLETHESRSPSRWNSPAYLIANGNYVFAIGTEIRAFHADSLDRPVWRLPAPPRSSIDDGPLDGIDTPFPPGALDIDIDRLAAPETMTLVGRVQAVDNALVVPTLDGLLLVDGETGQLDHHLKIEAAGNPLAVGSQLILAGGDELEVYMSLRRAEQMLRERIATSSVDPEPAMSLLQLGLRVGKLDMALEGAELALAAIERRPLQTGPADLRRELFNMLLEIHRRRIASTADEASALYALIGRVAATNDQRVEYLIAHGDGLVERVPEDAVEIYQSILSEPAYAALVRGEAGILRPAGHWASDRLISVIEEHGPSVYEPQADYARRTLAPLLAAAPRQDDALVRLSLEYPFADAALRAAIEAARQRRDRGDDLGAITALSTAYRAWPDRGRVRSLLGPLVEICTTTGRMESARLILAGIVRDSGDVQLETSRGTRRARTWLAELALPGTDGRRARIGLYDRPADVLEARLLPRAEGARVEAGANRALLLGKNSLRLVSSDALATLWTSPVPESDAELLLFDSDELLLWLGNSTTDPQIRSLDPRTGTTRWSSPPLDELLEDPWNQARGVLSQMPDGLPFDPSASLAFVGQDNVFMVRRSGGVAALDRNSGETSWTVERTLEQVHLVHPHAYGLALVGLGRDLGRGGGGGGDLVPRVVVLDQRTGELRHRLRPQAGVFWIAADPLGSLVCASHKGIELFDLLTGRRRWTNVAFDAIESQRGWLAGNRVIVEGRTNSLFSIRLEDGAMSPTFDTAVRGNWEPDALYDIHLWDDRIVARYRDRIIRFDVDGNVLGADIVSDSREYRLLIPGADSFVVVSQHDTRQQQIPGEVGRRTQRTYRLYMLSENCRLEGDVIELQPTTNRILAGALIDGWLLLSSSDQTLALPLPLE